MEKITEAGDDTLFPQPSTGTYTSKNFYLKAVPANNAKYRITVTLDYIKAGAGNATRTTTINDYLP